MARYTEAVCRLCRRENQKLFLKGDKCYGGKCPVDRRSYAPGQHGQQRSRKASEYALQLREKQKTTRFYGIYESQMQKYFELAEKKSGITGENLLAILETRLDNVVYRMGYAMSRPEARQLVNHSHFTVNGRKVNIPSFRVKPGDVVALREKSRAYDKFKDVIEANASRPYPKWLEKDGANFAAKIIAMPDRADIDLPVEEHLIVELYSK